MKDCSRCKNRSLHRDWVCRPETQYWSAVSPDSPEAVLSCTKTYGKCPVTATPVLSWIVLPFPTICWPSLCPFSLWWCVDPWDEQQTTGPSLRVGDPSAAACPGSHKHSLSTLTLFITWGLGRDSWHCEMLAWAWEAVTGLSPWMFLVPFAQIKSFSLEMQMIKIHGFLAVVVFWESLGFICGAAGAAQGILWWSGCHAAVLLLPFIYWDFCMCAQWCPTLQPHRLLPARLLCSWDFPAKNTGVGCHFLLQGIFLTQGSNLCLLCLLHWQAGSLPLGLGMILF